MSIRSNVGAAPIAVAVADTTILNPLAPLTRVGVTAFSLHNTDTVNSITVNLWESPNLTSASGTKVAYYSIGPSESVDVEEIIAQGYDVGRNIIGQASAVGVVARLTVTEYDGTS